jgi:hypothetical protein
MGLHEAPRQGNFGIAGVWPGFLKVCETVAWLPKASLPADLASRRF